MPIHSNILAAATILSSALPLYAEDVAILSLAPITTESAEDDVVYVDRHEVLLLDVSGSMDDADVNATLNGVVNHYISAKALADYNAGICTANTLVFYGSRPHVLDTQVICGPDDLQNFVSTLDDLNLLHVRAMTDSNTSLTNAMMAATRVFEGEDDLGISAGQHSVIVIGDELGGSASDLRELSIGLTARFGATVNAISINNSGLTSSFSEIVSTHEQDARLYYIRAGITQAATNPEEVRTMLQEILRLNQG